MKLCSACGAEMDADAIFCNACGQAQQAVVATLPLAVSDPERPRSLDLTAICPRCNATLRGGAKFCSECAYSFQSVAGVREGRGREKIADIGNDPVSEGSEYSSSLVAAVMRRYREAYLYSNFINGVGAMVVFAGIGVGAIGMFIGTIVTLAIENSAAGSSFGTGIILGALIIVFALLFGSLFLVVGILVRALAQMMKASLDSAVNTSPFVTDRLRATMMSLPLE